MRIDNLRLPAAIYIAQTSPSVTPNSPLVVSRELAFKFTLPDLSKSLDKHHHQQRQPQCENQSLPTARSNRKRHEPYSRYNVHGHGSLPHRFCIHNGLLCLEAIGG